MAYPRLGAFLGWTFSAELHVALILALGRVDVDAEDPEPPWMGEDRTRFDLREQQPLFDHLESVSELVETLPPDLDDLWSIVHDFDPLDASLTAPAPIFPDHQRKKTGSRPERPMPAFWTSPPPLKPERFRLLVCECKAAAATTEGEICPRCSRPRVFRQK